MSVLTQGERDGLDEVFLSIHATNKNYMKGLFHIMNFKKVFKEFFNTNKVKYTLLYANKA